jgi:cytochrome c peroxidase
MSWTGRSWANLANKLLSLAPLAKQQVSESDSLLGPLANPGGNGLQPQFTYAALISAAFQPEYSGAVSENFSVLWAIALDAYQRTLISDDSPVDRYLGGDPSALNAQQIEGLQQFQSGAAQCTRCHNGPELSSAAYTSVLRGNNRDSRNPADLGFFRIGTAPVEQDLGLGGTNADQLPIFIAQPAIAARGTFKAPMLRNVEFTGPYFHNGSAATLDQVLDFYNRGGDFPQGGNLGPGINNIRLNQNNRNAIVAFLRALTDERVRFQRAPFDHPSLCIPVGHEIDPSGNLAIDLSQPGTVARDRWALIPHMGREGALVPLQSFDELLRGIGNDGTRANHLNTACSPD